MPPQRNELRDFILQRFNREELGLLCGDYFPDFYRDYDGTNTTLTVLTTKLVEHCERRDLLDNLRTAVHKARSDPYEKQFGRPRVTEVKARPRNPNQVFLSYAHEDAELAWRVANDLRAAGLAVWMAPDSIQPGELWAKAIDRGLRESGIFAVLLTPQAAASGWVEHEIFIAVGFERSRQMRHLIPLLAQPCDLNALPAVLVPYQFVDLVGRYDDGMRQVLARLGAQPKARLAPEITDVIADSMQFVRKGVLPLDSLLIELPNLNFHLELVRVPAGEFLMGSDNAKDPNAYNDELPQHRVVLDEFYIGKYPVTVAQFAVFAQATNYKTTAEQQRSAVVWDGKEWKNTKGANWQHPRGPKSDVSQKHNHPVTCVSWDDALAFCMWLSQASGRAIQLPSEAQWEKAARGADGRIYPWGNDPPDDARCNFHMNAGDTTPIGKYSPLGDSIYGCADMSGNVWEWTRSVWGKDGPNPEFKYPYTERMMERENVNATNDYRRMLRGGGFNYAQESVRCAARDRYDPHNRRGSLGFRVYSLPIYF